MIRLYVFDLDGTLIDSLTDLAESVNELLGACGARRLEEPVIAGFVGDGAATLVARAFEEAGVPRPADALERFVDVYASRLMDHTRAYAGVPELLSALHGRADLAVLTNKPREATGRLLEGLDLAKYFDEDAVIGGDGPFARKPDPAGLLWLAARSGAPVSETILVGDSAIDWQTARNAGTRLCLVRYGFGFGRFAGQLTDEDAVINSPQDLVSL
jgi:phosphoglycolate phosphatase